MRKPSSLFFKRAHNHKIKLGLYVHPCVDVFEDTEKRATPRALIVELSDQNSEFVEAGPEGSDLIGEGRDTYDHS